MAMGTAHDVGRRVGMAMTIFAMGALAGPPISGAINAGTGGYKAVGYYAGTWHLKSPLLCANGHFVRTPRKRSHRCRWAHAYGSTYGVG